MTKNTTTSQSMIAAGLIREDGECTATQSTWNRYGKDGLCRTCHLPSNCHEY